MRFGRQAAVLFDFTAISRGYPGATLPVSSLWQPRMGYGSQMGESVRTVQPGRDDQGTMGSSQPVPALETSMKTARNHMTTPHLSYADWRDLAAGLGCVGVEVRNDIATALFDGVPASGTEKMAADEGMRLVGLNLVDRFDARNPEGAAAVRALIATARAADAETISLIPPNDRTGPGIGKRQANLRPSLKPISPLMQGKNLLTCCGGFGLCALITALRTRTGRDHRGVERRCTFQTVA
ncbi:hypothetical protein [Pseudorhodobacter sp.]|uniref:hypothetical protein n=1 Tax=Pseudorhodobacter sp. TaxID=1934400 RepID=UPI002648A039|nr:hypothetical protein [Pseudorhodobacter sp.]MDN5787096.1 hypothetical protein [Pseudorhodobacter sp.]